MVASHISVEVVHDKKGVWESRIKENASTKALGSYNRTQGGICAKEEKSVLTVKGYERGDVGICGGSVEERLYPTIEVTLNIASTFCG